MTIIRKKYLGITHPLDDDLLEFEEFRESWKIANCANGMHLFDEVLNDDNSHYLHCDICKMEVHIKEIVIPDGKEKVIE